MDRRERHQKVKELFFAAIEIEPNQRTAFLDQSCGKDRTLRDEVQTFLALDAEEVKDLIDTPADRHLAHLAEGGTSSSGTGSSRNGVTGTEPGVAWSTSCETTPDGQLLRVGSYRIIEELHKDRAGTSYRAELMGASSHRAVLKLSQTMCHEPLRWCRFEVERQVLKQIDHPMIARVYDAGDTDEGHVYIATEPVTGQAISEYCDQRQLLIDDRLRLLIKVCRAVQHVHQKGLLHRDLRSENVIIDDDQGEAVVRLIGFAIARPLQDSFPGPTLLALTGASESAGFDIRSDVYGLGMLLALLLTGSTSYRPGQSAPPQLPSQSVAALAPQAAGDQARARRTTPSALVRLLRGDLDWIVRKATAAEPEQRYPSVAELVTDLELYRKGRPVAAAPDSPRYRFRKLLQRGRAAVIVVAIISLALVTGVSWKMLELRQERDHARQEIAAVREVAKILTTLFETTDDEVDQGPPPELREVLEQDPLQLAAALRSLADESRARGQSTAAELLLNAVLIIYQQELPPDHPDLLATAQEYERLRLSNDREPTRSTADP